MHLMKNHGTDVHHLLPYLQNFEQLSACHPCFTQLVSLLSHTHTYIGVQSRVLVQQQLWNASWTQQFRGNRSVRANSRLPME